MRSNVDYVTIRSSDEFVEAFEWLQKNAQYCRLAVVDTATELQRMVVQEIEEVRNKGLMPDQQVWGAVLNWREHYAREFRTLPMHVLWTAPPRWTATAASCLGCRRRRPAGSTKHSLVR